MRARSVAAFAFQLPGVAFAEVVEIGEGPAPAVPEVVQLGGAVVRFRPLR